MKRYQEPMAHGPEACEPSRACGSRSHRAEILMVPGSKPSCLTTLPAVRHCQSQCQPTDSQTHLQSGGDLWCPDLGQSAWETGGLRSRRLRPDCMGTPPCMAFVVMGRGKRRP